MNIYKRIFLGLTIASGLLAAGCSDEDYVEANTNPDVIQEVTPENQFFAAAQSLQSNDFEAFYDQFRLIMPFMQYVSPQGGNGRNFTRNIDNFGKRYDRLYIGVGNALYDIEKTIEGMEPAEQAKYVNILAISRVLKAYYAFYVSDTYGDIAYTDAWQARYGGTLQPTYDKQHDLFLKLDGEIEASVATLKTAPAVSQAVLGNYDPYYGGTAASWVKAANALRLRLAMRLLRNDDTNGRAIINEVLAEPAENLMSQNGDGWVFKANSGFVSGGNWSPDLLTGTKPLVDFMWDNDDPRLDAFFSPNDYSKTNIDSLIKYEELEPGTTESARRYFGSFTSPDDVLDPDNAAYYLNRTYGGIIIDTLSLIQRRLFQPSFDEGSGGGDGQVYMPILTYAEFCFMRAELAARGITTENAADLYTAGVTASIQWYNTLAVDGKLSNYTPLGGTEINDYLATTGIAYDPAIGLSQISSQAYINFFKQPSEGWGWWRRTGLPNETTVLELPDMISSGAALPIPRRMPLPLLSEISANYENQKAAYDAMLADPEFGTSTTDVFGRVWWDKE
jgi:hypothetical protein